MDPQNHVMSIHFCSFEKDVPFNYDIFFGVHISGAKIMKVL